MKLNIIIITLLCVPFLIGLVFLSLGFAEWESYDSNQWVQVPAEITKIEEEEYMDDGANGTYYDAYVTYEYNGKVYSNIKYDYKKSYQVGSVITVEIDPLNPTDFRPNDHPAFLILGISLTLIFVIPIKIFTTAIFVDAKKRRNWASHYSSLVLTEDLVKDEIVFEYEQRKKYSTRFCLIFTLALIAVTLAHFLVIGFTWMPIATALILLFFFIYYGKSSQMNKNKINNMRLALSSDQLVLAEKDDGDGGTLKVLKLVNKQTEFNHSSYVSLSHKLSNENAGDDVFVVTDNDRVIRVFNSNEFRMFG